GGPPRAGSRGRAARADARADCAVAHDLEILRQHVVGDDPVRPRRDAAHREARAGGVGPDDRTRSRLRRRGRAPALLMEREEHAREYLDGPLPASDLAASLADIERLAIFGGHRLSVRAIAREAANIPRDRRLVVLDVGGGRGDLA